MTNGTATSNLYSDSEIIVPLTSNSNLDFDTSSFDYNLNPDFDMVVGLPALLSFLIHFIKILFF